MGILTETFANWENGKTEPVAAQFRPVMEFLGYDPTPAPKTLAERLEAKRRALGITFEQAAKYLGWDPIPEWDKAPFTHQINLLGSIPLR